MTNKIAKNPARQPILFVWASGVSAYSNEAYAKVQMEFRYYKEGCSHLQTYWLIDFNEAGGYYDDLSCHYSLNGAIRRRNDDEFNGHLYPLQYQQANDLNERKLREMLKTLKRINRKLDAISAKEGCVNSLSEYARRLAGVVKAKEIAIGPCQRRYPILEGLPKIDDLIRATRKECLKAAGNDEKEKDVYKWCEHHDYSEPQFLEGEWRAFPPNGVMSVPIDEFVFG